MWRPKKVMEQRNTNSSRLIKASERLYYLPYEEETDRPNLYYIRGDDYAVAVDAGNSEAHVRKFYEAIQAMGFELPRYTFISHWHWDHTFGLHAIKGMSVSTSLCHDKLSEVAGWEWSREAMNRREETGEDIPFCTEHILKEYPDLSQIKVVETDACLDEELILDAGGIRIRMIPRDSTHSRDALFVYLPEEKALIVQDADCEDFYHGAVYDRDRLRDMIAFFEALDYEDHYLGHAEKESKAEALRRLKDIESGLE